MGWVKINISDKEVRSFEQTFKKKTRFLVDEDCGRGAAELLRDLGYNAKYVSDLDLKGRDDEAVFNAAWKEDRVLITHDDDFEDDRRFPEQCNPGVIILPMVDGDEFVRILLFALSIFGKYRHLWRQAKVIVYQDRKVTIKHRNRRTGAMEKTNYKFTKSGPALIWVNNKRKSTS
jgi:predicted nuclease of predicted toxin-antitoxin system